VIPAGGGGRSDADCRCPDRREGEDRAAELLLTLRVEIEGREPWLLPPSGAPGFWGG